MIKKNYNGTINRKAMRDLRHLCDENARAKTPLEELNLELDNFPSYYNDIAGDYLMSTLIEFIRKSGKFPEKKELQHLEKEAEKKRIASLTTSNTTEQKELSCIDVATEILELSEEIIESRLVTCPDDIFTDSDMFSDKLTIEDSDFKYSISCNLAFGYPDYRSYSCYVIFPESISAVAGASSFLFKYDAGNFSTHIHVEQCQNNLNFDQLTNALFDVHKLIVKKAKEEGIEFASEIDYSKIDCKDFPLD